MLCKGESSARRESSKSTQGGKSTEAGESRESSKAVMTRTLTFFTDISIMVEKSNGNGVQK
jgi:hypothetical protein